MSAHDRNGRIMAIGMAACLAVIVVWSSLHALFGIWVPW